MGSHMFDRLPWAKRMARLRTANHMAGTEVDRWIYQSRTQVQCEFRQLIFVQPGTFVI